MTLAIKTVPSPLSLESDGTVRVGGARVLLDAVISAFRDGASAEQIVQQLPALDLADVYAVISYYLRNTAEINAYVLGRREDADRLRVEIEAHFDPSGIRDRLLARRNAGS